MRPHRFVVLGQRVHGFDTLAEARAHAMESYPAVVCERVTDADGATTLVEVLRHDFWFDEARRQWRVMLSD